MLGMHGKTVSNQAIMDSDLLIIIGARVSDRAVLLPADVSKTKKIVHIDIDPAEIGKNLSTMIPVVGDAKEVLAQAMEMCPCKKDDEWTSLLKARKAKHVLDYEPRKKGINPKKPGLKPGFDVNSWN